MDTDELADALTAHVSREPPDKDLLNGETDVAVIDALIVGVATSVVEHEGLVADGTLITLARNVVELELAMASPSYEPHPYVDSLLMLARLTESWFLQ